MKRYILILLVLTMAAVLTGCRRDPLPTEITTMPTTAPVTEATTGAASQPAIAASVHPTEPATNAAEGPMDGNGETTIPGGTPNPGITGNANGNGAKG